MNKIPVGVYARVSSDKQAEGDSIEHQISQLNEYIKTNLGNEYYSDESLTYIDEAISGFYTSVTDRPDVQKMLEDGKKGKFKVALFREISRLGRDGEEIIKLPRIFESYGVRVIAINDSYDSDKPERKMLLPISSLLAEIEAEKISVRVSDGNRSKARNGQWATVTPLGYKINQETKKLEIDEKNAEVVKLIFDLYVNKRWGGRLISNHLNSLGYTTKKGLPFQAKTLTEIIKNPVYLGQVIYGKNRSIVERIYDDNRNLVKKKKSYKKTEPIIVYDAHPPIIDEYIFYKAQEIMKTRNKNSTSNRAKYPLVGIARCAKCGGNIICQSRNFEGKYLFRYYKCSTNHKYGDSDLGCRPLSINASKLERSIFETLIKEVEKLKNVNAEEIGIIETNSLQTKLDKLENEKRKLIKNQITTSEERDLFAPDVYREKMINLKQKIENVEQQIQIVNNQLLEVSQRKSNITEISRIIDTISKIDLSDLTELRAFFHSMIDEVIIEDKNTIKKIQLKYDIPFDLLVN